LKIFEEVRQKYEFQVVGYVVMPEHIHLLIGEPAPCAALEPAWLRNSGDGVVTGTALWEKTGR
jgi:REP element-mobilizing transposase RayT